MIRRTAGDGLFWVAIVSTAILAASLAWASEAESTIGSYRGCPHARAGAPTTSGGKRFVVSQLRVRGMSCSGAAEAVRRGAFELTPGGALFHTPGFRCVSPVGAPPRNGATRSYSCRQGSRAFAFIVPGVR